MRAKSAQRLRELLRRRCGFLLSLWFGRWLVFGLVALLGVIDIALVGSMKTNAHWLASGATPNLRRMGLDEHSCASDTAQLIIAISIRGSKLKSSQVIEL